MKLLEHAMKTVKRVLERQIRTLINGTLDAIFIVRKMQKDYQKKDKKLYKCFVKVEKAF